MSTAHIFLTWLDDDRIPNVKDLRRYFLFRKENDIATRTRAKEFVQLKTLFEANGWEWTFTRRDKPKPKEDPYQPAFPPDEVLQLIAAREDYTDQENFYLAVSTTFGTRRGEMGLITKRDLKENTIFIHTEKGGVQRQQPIPEEIVDILSAWRPRERKGGAINYAFQSIMEKSGLGRRPHWGFHCIRRTLQTLLIINLAKNSYSPSMAGDYLRWSKRSTGMVFLGSAMAGLYSHPEILSADSLELDRICQSVHPFLSAYQSNGTTELPDGQEEIPE